MLERTVITLEITSAKQMEAAGRRLGKAVLDPSLYDKDVYLALYAPHRSGKTTFSDGIEKSLPKHLRREPGGRSFTEDHGCKNYPWHHDQIFKQEENAPPAPRTGETKIHVAEHDFFKNVIDYCPGVVILVSHPDSPTRTGGINNKSYFDQMETSLRLSFPRDALPEAGKFLAEQFLVASEDKPDGSEKRIVRIFLMTEDPDIRAKFLEFAETFEPKPSLPLTLNERLRNIGAHP